MKPHALIYHSISLVLRLIDSITGLPIEERDVRFLLPSDKNLPIAKGEGAYLFVNAGREDFELEIHIYGYESKKAKIFYDALDEQVPIQELYFLPKDYPAGRKNVLTLRGKISGITEIEAVPLNDVVYSIKEYEEWVDKYIAVVKKYNANPTDLSILSEYTSLVTELADWTERADDVSDSIEDIEDAAEYSAELMRIAAKLADAAGDL